jgi:3'(2'), 5'-bisphosphate nucleotidase
MSTPIPGFAALERLASIASDAGDTVMTFFGTSVGVDHKEDSSPVTAADRAAHACIVRQLVDWDSGTPIVSEEGALPPFDQRQEWKRFWLVDPLDGTKEFILGNGEFTVNIALIVDGEPVLGVVGAPALNTMFLAARGCGSWRCVSGGAFEPLRGADVNRRGAVRVVESRSHGSQELEAFLATLGDVERIKLGSSLKFCRIAEGTADLYPRFGRTMEWDVAAGDCVYRNSGPHGQQRSSPLIYNQPTLSTPRFVIGQVVRQ